MHPDQAQRPEGARSNAAVLQNREASLLVRYPGVARYFAEIFESDWSTATQKLPGKSDPETAAPAALARGNFVEVSYGDYVQF